MQLSRLCCDRW